MKHILSLQNISKTFKKTKVLEDISLDIDKGKIISLLGKSGSGKTTLLNIIAGFEMSDSGRMSLNNKIIFDKNNFTQPQKRNIGFVFQNYALFPHMNIFDNITFGVDNKPQEEKQKIVNGLLKLVELEGLEKRYPHELSGGQQQRIALVRAMALNPQLILLDEPFSSIDSMVKATIQKQLLNILKSSHKTAVIVTHDASEAMALSDKIIYLEEGKIIQYDTPQNIYKYPKSKQVAMSFGIASFITKEDKTYCIRPNDVTFVENGEYRVYVKSKLYQGENYIYEVKLNNELITLYSTQNIEEEYSYIAINWENLSPIDC
jgi:iron(III) transport system ATP-binding protein